MANVAWGILNNIENSLVEFLQAAITTETLTVPDDKGNPKTPEVRVGFENDGNWELPVISLYGDQRTSPRGFVGSNKRLNAYLIVIDVRALHIGMQNNLTDWLQKTVNDGFPYYEYVPNISDPDNPTKTLAGYVSLEFISNLPVRLGDTADMFEKYRQNITISCFIEGCAC